MKDKTCLVTDVFLGAALPALFAPTCPDAWITFVLSVIISPLSGPIWTPRSVNVPDCYQYTLFQKL